MKLAVIGIVAADAHDPVKMARIAFFRKNYELAKSPNTAITFLSALGGLFGTDMVWDAASSHYLMALNAAGIIETAIEAERRGFDAIIIHCGHDPSLLECRQAVNIPVVGLLEASVAMASLMAGRYGVVLIDDDARWIVGEAISRYGFSEKLVSMRPLPADLKEQAAGMAAPTDILLDKFITISRALIADGAGAIVAACSGQSAMTRLAPGSTRFPQGLTEIDGVPIVDMLSAGTRMAEMMVGIKAAGSPWISRKGLHHRPSKAAREMSARDHRPTVPTFWQDVAVDA